MVHWRYNESRVVESEAYTFSPPNLDHTLAITKANVEDSGEYVCYVENFQMLVNAIITLNVLPSNKLIVCTVTMYISYEFCLCIQVVSRVMLMECYGIDI